MQCETSSEDASPVAGIAADTGAAGATFRAAVAADAAVAAAAAAVAACICPSFINLEIGFDTWRFSTGIQQIFRLLMQDNLSGATG